MIYTLADLEAEAALAAHVGVRLELADAAHGVLMHVLAIKANPPTYNAVVANMGDLLASEFGMQATGPVVKASADIGAWADDPSLTGPQKQGKARERVGALQKELEALGQPVNQDTGKTVGRYLAIAYKLGLAETTKPLGWQADFTMADRDAVHGLHNSGLFWIGSHYGDALGEMPQVLAEVDKVMLKGGLGRKEGGRAIAKLLGSKIQRSDAYWTGFAATVATRARSFGALSGMASCGATRYEYVNPLDERTSDVCRALDGTLFTVKGGLQLRDKLLAAKTPEEWKAISPWPKPKDLLAADGSLKKPGELQAAGIAWPPLHFHCRSTVEVRIWTPLGQDELDPMGDVDPYAVKPPKVAPQPMALPDLVPEPVLPPPWEPDLPPQVLQGNPKLDDWRILLEMQGYTPAEIDALLAADNAGLIPLPSALDSAIVDGDVPGIVKILQANPPANPAVFDASLFVPEGTWSEVAELTPWALEDVDKWLYARGYTKDDLACLFDTNMDGTKLLPSNLISPTWSRWRLAKFVKDNPPGSTSLAQLIEAQLAAEEAAWLAEQAAIEAAQAAAAAKAAQEAAEEALAAAAAKKAKAAAAKKAKEEAAAAAAAQAAEEAEFAAAAAKQKAWQEAMQAQMAAEAEAAQAAALAAEQAAAEALAAEHAKAAALASLQADAAKAAAHAPGTWLPDLQLDAPELATWAKFKKWAKAQGYTDAELVGAEFGGQVAAAFDAYTYTRKGIAKLQLGTGSDTGLTKTLTWLTPDGHKEAWRSASAILRARPPAGLKVAVVPWEPGPAAYGWPPFYDKVGMRGYLRGLGYSKDEAAAFEALGWADSLAQTASAAQQAAAKKWKLAHGYGPGLTEQPAYDTPDWLELQQVGDHAGGAALRKRLGAEPPSILQGAPVHVEDGHLPLFYTTGGSAPASAVAAKPAVQAAQAASKVIAAEFTAPGSGPSATTILGQKVGEQAGSNKGGFYLGTDGVKRYVKWYKNKTQAESENLANAIYRALGLGAPKTGVLEHAGETIYWSEILEGATLGDTGLTVANAQEFMRGFAADVLTANWDSAGLTMDNALITKAGQLVRIDNGGSLLFRAQGTLKPAAVLDKIPEWEGFFDAGLNPTYAKIAAKAGYKSADDLLPIVKVQVDEMAKLRDSVGGWKPLVEKMAPNATQAERDAMAGMLEARFKLLQGKVAHLKGPPVPVSVAPAGSVPPVPHVHAAAVPKGPVDVHGGYAWQPDVPPKEIGDWKPAQTKIWLQGQGYTDAEIAALQPELNKAMLKANLDASKLGVPEESLIPGHVLSHLEAHPPGKVVAVSVKPPAFLSPAELGTRLQATGSAAGKDLGDVYADHLTGERWMVRHHTDERQARSTTVANMLYRRLGIEAPHSRVIQLPDGRVGVATREWTGWTAPMDVNTLASKHGETLAREMPADAFLANWNVLGTDGRRVLVRDAEIPGMSSVLRSNNDGVLAWRTTGASKGSSWVSTDVPELDTFLDATKAPQAAQAFAAAVDDPSLMLPMMDKIGALTNADIELAVKAGGFAPAEATELRAALMGRRDAVRLRAKALRKRIEDEAAERVKAEAERAARLAAQVARGGGKVIRRPRLGVDLRHATDDLKAGEASFAGDHGVVRHQQIVVQRYKMEASAKVQHEGFWVRMQVDERHWADVEKALQKKGAKNGTFRAWARTGFGTKADTAASPVLRLDALAPNQQLGPGFTLSTPTVEVDFAGSIGLQANKGELRLLIKTTDPAAAQALLESTMKELTVDSALLAPTDDAAFLAGANRALWNLYGTDHKRITDIKKAEAALRKEGVDPTSVRSVTSGGRGYQTVKVEGRGQKYRKKGLRFLYHEYGSPEVAPSLLGTDGGQGGLLATVDRTMKGIIRSGASSGTDMGTGGASSVFLRVVGKGGTATTRWYESFGENKVLLDADLLDRMDFYGFTSDKFGVTHGSGYDAWKGAEQLIPKLITNGSSGNEVMFRHEVPVDAFLLMPTSSASARTAVLAKLKSQGVKTVRGRPIDEFVVVMYTPTDFSKLTPKTNQTHAYIMGLADEPLPWEPPE